MKNKEEVFESPVVCYFCPYCDLLYVEKCHAEECRDECYFNLHILKDIYEK